VSFQYDGPEYSVSVEDHGDCVRLHVNAHKSVAYLPHSGADEVAVALIQATPVTDVDRRLGESWIGTPLESIPAAELRRLGLALIRSAK
jgi:hypothetical protein